VLWNDPTKNYTLIAIMFLVEGCWPIAKEKCWAPVFESVGDRDVADAAYRDVSTAVSKTGAQRFSATGLA